MIFANRFGVNENVVDLLPRRHAVLDLGFDFVKLGQRHGAVHINVNIKT